ncbi:MULTISPECIES: LysR family transcriptional regulator [Marivita]|uniref:LysR family transcriptional regulator n=1 Tax=Marivita cryptomonadis TaxID=505252 RepID=A0A9Q2NYY0_9RHOB|nr:MULTISPECIES: LysR family transcriptional regulator [Marivita]MCR9167416.1 LysR family transcriptional regulator [Paracoccaceae bacterium]MBM2322535.1 LysR family transcriptional regulator [Marivita cryptomonadis]MBM2332117.1 LysR family transcriptional regulator [Marivita cryptomonadis]MBM2341701.1 LysR family transcriptional regulator [Marivita cryptomonadis]MBM2346365.1 LysR family transcriptional regulator [Marivita cryptomonadis]
MNFKQLTYFIAVAEELHFGRAAERLDMAQPPLSRQIKQLEEELGAILFNRGRSAISLTQAGERLLARGKTIVSQLEDTKLEVRRLGQGAEGRLRIGFVGSATFGILPNIIRSYRANYPEVNLSLIPMNNADLHRALVSRELDVVFARPTLKDPEFLSKHLIEEKLILALPDIVDTGSRTVAKLERLMTHNLILYPERPRPSYADMVLKAVEDAGFQAPMRIWCMDLQTALSLVAVGEGVCIVPESVSNAPRKGMKFLKIDPEIARTELSLNYRLDEQGVHVKHFVSIAQKVARKTF